MSLFRRIFNINTIILGFAIMLMVMVIHFIIRSYDGFETLVPHSGAVESKHFSYHYSTHRNTYMDRDELDSNLVFNFKVGDNPQWYTASRLQKVWTILLKLETALNFTRGT